MAEADDSPDDNFEEHSSRLSEGLKSCRTVVSDYRALLAFEQLNQPQLEEKLDLNRPDPNP